MTTDELLATAFRQWRDEHPLAMRDPDRDPVSVFVLDAERVAYRIERGE